MKIHLVHYVLHGRHYFEEWTYWTARHVWVFLCRGWTS